MSKVLKIAVYSGEIPSTTFIERLIVGLSKKDCKVYLFGVLSQRMSYNASVKLLGYRQNRLFKLLYLLKYNSLLFFTKAAQKKQFDRFLKSEGRNDLYSKVKYYPVLYYQPDVFHLQWAKGIGEWAWVEDFGIRLIVSLRGAHINYSPIADAELADEYKTYFPKISGFHAVSKAIAKVAVTYGAPADLIKVVYSGLPLADIQTEIETEREASGLDNLDIKTLHIISVGRPHWIKGYVHALDACKQLKRLGIPFTYTIVGGNSDIELLYQINDLELNGEVTLTEHQSYQAVQMLIENADVLLLPSHKEGVANVVLEAMAMGTLVLSTDCGGMNEVVVDGENGFLTPIRDFKHMAERLQHISKLSTEEKTKLKRNAIQTITAQHTEPLMISKMMALYADVVANNL
ncbi:glycosyltransferase family 4 protein [Sediminibacter sp. Hel_I_10]|uniref:glycosyltransferase family 4 protein n=1 Tax=Sediminibacter sp. Hel_I_10 TaxID=1392490 RepID=UPI00047ED4C0|nr:glycosyltransferase family 4 protein [Sediminibacter sp. Hel_I_10]